MRKIINLIISKIKKQEFKIDNNIPISYLLGFILNKFIALLYGLILLRKFKLVFIHSSSIIKCKKKITFGRNLVVDRECYIDALSYNGITGGRNVVIGKCTTIECTGNFKYLGKGLQIGDDVSLGTHGFFGCAGGIKIGKNTIMGNYVSFHSENHIFSDLLKPIKEQGVSHLGIDIGENCWIGSKVTILDGVQMGEGCVIAAGAVVIRGTYPDNCILGGTPAKILKYRNSDIIQKIK